MSDPHVVVLHHCAQTRLASPFGSPGPNLYLAEGVKQNRFRIAGGRPYAHVSWQVTGVRQDAYANDRRIQVEDEKSRVEGALVAQR